MTAMNPRPTPSRQARPRAALVSRDPATASHQAEVLRAAGYDVETCGGPQHEPCPVVGGLPCPMVDRADVLIYDAWVAGSAEAGRQLVAELREMYADLPLVLTAGQGVSVQLFYRHVNHGERWRSTAMSEEGDTMRAAIPGTYTNSPYPLQYYFVLQNGTQAWLHPGFNATLSNQPYFAVWKRS